MDSPRVDGRTTTGFLRGESIAFGAVGPDPLGVVANGADIAAGPIRTCVGCRRRAAQAGLRRFVRAADGWRADAGRRSAGRGVYLCSAVCAGRVAKNKRYPGLSREALVQW